MHRLIAEHLASFADVLDDAAPDDVAAIIDDNDTPDEYREAARAYIAAHGGLWLPIVSLPGCLAHNDPQPCYGEHIAAVMVETVDCITECDDIDATPYDAPTLADWQRWTAEGDATIYLHGLAITAARTH